MRIKLVLLFCSICVLYFFLLSMVHLKAELCLVFENLENEKLR